MALAHSFQEDSLVATVMNEPRIGDSRKGIEELFPYALLPFLIVSPKAVLNSAVSGSDANAYQVVEITVRQALDIQIDRGAVEFRIQEIDDVYLVLADRERPQRIMKFLRLASRFPAASSRTKRVGEL